MAMHEPIKRETYAANDWGDKLSFTVGSSYLMGCLLGLSRGAFHGLPASAKMPKKLMMNNFFNSVGRETSRFANGFAGASFIYYMTASTLNYLLEDELAEFTNLQRNMLCGGISGALFKSTLGLVPVAVGAGVGAALLGALTGGVSMLNERGWVAFEIKF
jgi:import inner membrane translocase subunit TIM23